MLNDHDFLTVLNDILYYYFREFVVIQLLAWKIPTSERFQNQLRKKCYFCGAWKPRRGLRAALKSYQYLVILTGHKNHSSRKVNRITILSMTKLFSQNVTFVEWLKMSPSGNLHASKNRTDSRKKVLVRIFVVKKYLEFIYGQLILLPSRNPKCKLNFAHIIKNKKTAERPYTFNFSKI